MALLWNLNLNLILLGIYLPEGFQQETDKDLLIFKQITLTLHRNGISTSLGPANGTHSGLRGEKAADRGNGGHRGGREIQLTLLSGILTLYRCCLLKNNF